MRSRSRWNQTNKFNCKLQYLMNHMSSDLLHPVPGISYAMQINTSFFHNLRVCRFDNNFRCNFCWCFPCHSQSHVRTVFLSADMRVHCLCPVWTSNIILIPCILLQITIHKITLNYFCRGHPLVLRNWETIINLFQANTTIFYPLPYRRQVSVIRPSSGHLYMKFKTGHM
jgi:hypothetical protein